MIYFFRIPPGMGEDYEFDGEHANCCAICKYNGNIYVDTNECGVYYDPPLDCDDKDDCKRWYETFIKQYKKCDSCWDLRNQC